MTSTRTRPASGRWHRLRSRPALTVVAAMVLVAVAVGVWVLQSRASEPPGVALPLRPVGEVTLPGDSSRFDYASLDPGRGLLFIAHLGASEVIEVDVRSGQVLRTIPGLAGVHGVLVVPERHRVYATATNDDTMITLDEDTATVLSRTPTGAYPDGLAYDPVHATIWTTNETGGSETVIDADTGAPRGTVELGGQAGNVAYDPVTGQMLADDQDSNELVVIDPATLAVTRRVPLPGCAHAHGLALAPADRVAFIACDDNARLLTVDLTTGRPGPGVAQVGSQPDVLVYDPGLHRLYVAAESGPLTVLDTTGTTLTVTGRGPLGDGAHVVALDPATHRTYYPIPYGADGRPVLRAYEPTR